MKYCVECGNELRDSAKFCVNCGTKVEQLDPVELEESLEPVESVELVKSEEPAGSVEPEELVESVEPVKSVEPAGSVEPEEVVESVEPVEQVESASPLEDVSLEDAEHYFLEYLDFMKDLLLTPSSIFSKGTEVWIFGLVNLVLYSIVLALNTYGKFLITFFEMFVLQIAFVVVLFIVNKFIVKGTDGIFDALGKYGGLASGQIILVFFIWLLGVDSGFGGFLSLIASINQLLIFNTYIFESQTNDEPRVDNYYQLILSYIPFVIVMAFVINMIL